MNKIIIFLLLLLYSVTNFAMGSLSPSINSTLEGHTRLYWDYRIYPPKGAHTLTVKITKTVDAEETKYPSITPLGFITADVLENQKTYGKSITMALIQYYIKKIKVGDLAKLMMIGPKECIGIKIKDPVSRKFIAISPINYKELENKYKEEYPNKIILFWNLNKATTQNISYITGNISDITRSELNKSNNLLFGRTFITVKITKKNTLNLDKPYVEIRVPDQKTKSLKAGDKVKLSIVNKTDCINIQKI